MAGSKPRSDLSRLWRAYAPIIGAAITALGFGIKVVQMYDAHLRDDDRRDEKIRVLERVMLQEHPEYTLTIFP